MGFKLGEHQEYAIFMMDTCKQLGIFYDMGTGKTALSLFWILRKLKAEKNPIQDALVVCPATLVPSWRSAIRDLVQFDGVTAEDVELLDKSIHVTSYGKTYRSVKTPINHRNGTKSYKKSIEIREDVDKMWGAIFMDESQNIAAHDSIISKVAYKLSGHSEYRFILSGTPVHGGKGRPDYKKLYGQMRFLNPGIWASWSQFCSEMVASKDPWGNPYRYEEERCEKVMRDYGITCRLTDVRDMPPKMETTIDCPLSEKKIYKDITEGRILQYGFDVEANGGEWIKLIQVCSGSLKNDEGTLMLTTSKDDTLRDLLDSTEGPVVIYCNFTASVQRCADICRKAGRTTVVQDGRSKKDEWEKFARGEADAIVLQYMSGGAGLNLQRSCVEILYEPHPSADKLEQAKGRIFRTGQEHPCTYYFLCTPKTMEVKFWTTVRSGVDVTNEMMKQWSQES